MKALARFTRVIVSCLPLALVIMPLGCNNQGAGERCSRGEDCASGLECSTRPVTNMGNQGLCCPIDNPGSVPACIPKISVVPVSDASDDADALASDAPVETSSGTSSAVDATSDSDGAPATLDAETSDTTDADLADAGGE